MTFRSGGDLWTTRADGSEPQAGLELDRERDVGDMAWSPDGKWLVYRTDLNAAGAADILAFPSGQDTVPIPLVATEAREVTPTVSPNGRWLAYASDETGRLEVHVRPFPNAAEARWSISASGGREPVWAHSGRELFYRNDQGEMVVVAVETEPTFSVGQSSTLFSAPYSEFRSNGTGHREYDVTPDDQRFIMIRRTGTEASSELVWVQNFFEELRRRVPR